MCLKSNAMPVKSTNPWYAVVYNENHEALFSVHIRQTSLRALRDEPADVSIEGTIMRVMPSGHLSAVFPPDDG